MSNFTKQDILSEIKRTTEENENIPLGRDRFEKETGISSWEIGKYWARFSDAQQEAGFSPNELKAAHDEEFLLDSIVNLMRELKSFPTRGEMRLKRFSDPNFPSDTVYYRRFGGKGKLAKKISDFAKEKGLDDVLALCKEAIEEYPTTKKEDAVGDFEVGEVYLFKSGRYYKIGKTNDTVRRGTEIRIQLPEKLDLIHSIKTDDPSGVEMYWHRRFESKRMNGEWFDLNSNDIKAFKRWRKII
jgi:hypothetical protein